VIRIEPSDIRTAYEWYKRRDALDLEPPYQRRGGLWNRHAKAYLIDSMINRFDVPKFYVADLTLLPGSMQTAGKTHAVIDGKQRFETLFEWFSGVLRLNDDFVYLEDPLVNASGANRSDLSKEFPDLAGRVEDFVLSVMNVVADDQEQIDQLFIRLNQSQPLTGAETRNAMEGEAPGVIRVLAKHPFFKERIRFSVKRGGDLNTAAKILLLEFTGDFVDMKRRPLDAFVKEIAHEGTLASGSPDALKRAAERAADVFDQMCEVFFRRDWLLSTQGQVPVYYWLVRNFGPGPDVREFVEAFEADREANRRVVAELGSAGPIDRELLQYDQFNRSVNDRHSLHGRYEILRRRYERFGDKDVSTTVKSP
jgi:hypothetical protein